MNDSIQRAREFAILKHNKQKYGIYPYQIHLILAVNVLLRNGVFPNATEDQKILMGCWLHDTLEDTNTTKEELVENFGKEIYEIIWALTDGMEGSRVEKKKLCIKK